MTTLFNICFFVAIIFIYLHIINETKKSTQMEIYETEYVSNDNLQKICELKQPFIFDSPATLEDAIHINSADGELKTKDITDSVHYVNLNGSAFSKLVKRRPLPPSFKRDQRILPEALFLSPIPTNSIRVLLLTLRRYSVKNKDKLSLNSAELQNAKLLIVTDKRT